MEMKPTDYKDYYVTNDGRVWSAKSNIFLSPSIDKYGYKRVSMWIDGKQAWELIHRLVAKAFLPNPDNLPMVNHKDENPSNNNVANLEWVTAKQNCDWGTRNERISQTMKEVSKKRGDHAEAIAIKMCDKKTHEVIQIFDSLMSACDFLNKPQGWGNISKVLHGKYKSAYGYYWEKV